VAKGAHLRAEIDEIAALERRRLHRSTGLGRHDVVLDRGPAREDEGDGDRVVFRRIFAHEHTTGQRHLGLAEIEQLQHVGLVAELAAEINVDAEPAVRALGQDFLEALQCCLLGAAGTHRVVDFDLLGSCIRDGDEAEGEHAQGGTQRQGPGELGEHGCFLPLLLCHGVRDDRANRLMG